MASYMSTTVITGDERSADTFLADTISAVPPIRLPLSSKDDATTLLHAFHDYAAANGCD